MKLRPDKPRVVIVGANFAGLCAAKALPKSFDVSVLDPSPFFEFLPNIHELVSRKKRPGQLRISKRAILKAAGHRLIPESAAEWLPGENRIRTAGKRVLHYDYALCAVGGTTNFFGVTGAREIAFNFKSVEDCHAIGRALARRLGGGESTGLVIVGGGIEGVEALGEVLRRYGGNAKLGIHLVEGQKRLLSFGPPGLHDAVLEKCRGMPVAFHTETAVREVFRDRVALTDGRSIPADVVIWTGGVKPRGELVLWGLAPERGGWAPVNEFLQSMMQPDVFAAGDAALPGEALEKQAYHAMDMGRCAARNIVRLAKGKALVPFEPSRKPTLITLGKLDAYLVSSSLCLAGAGLSFAKEAVYQAVMPRFDPGPAGFRAARAAFRLAGGMSGQALDFALSPKDLMRLKDVRVIR